MPQIEKLRALVAQVVAMCREAGGAMIIALAICSVLFLMQVGVTAWSELIGNEPTGRNNDTVLVWLLQPTRG
jgi:hypothetical protein